MARDLQRAFLSSLEMTETQKFWDETDRNLNDPDFVPDVFPPAPCPLDNADQLHDSAYDQARLIDALRDAQHVGFTGDNTRELATRLNELHIRDLPSLEAFCEFPDNAVVVSLETLRESVKETLKAVLRALARFWAALMDQVQRWLESSKIARMRLLTAQSQLRGVAGRSAEKDKVTGSVIPALSTKDREADNARAILANLQDFAKQLSLLRTNYLPMVVRISKQFIAEFERWGTENVGDGVDAAGWLEGLNFVAREYKPAEALGAVHKYGDTQSPNYSDDAKQSECMPGYRWIVVLPAGKSDSSHTSLQLASVLQSARVVVEDVYPRSHKAPEDMDTMSQRDIERILQQTQILLDEIQTITQGDARRALKEMTLRMDRLANTNLSVPDGSVAIFQAGVAYARAISRWAKDPYQGVMFHAVNVCNNSVRMCMTHTRAYMPAPKSKETTP